MARFPGEIIKRALDTNGEPVSGARLRIFEAGTSTPVTAYSDEAMVTPHATPIVAASNGVFDPIYVPVGAYKVTLTTSADAALPGSPIDNIFAPDDLPLSEQEVTPTGGSADTIANLIGDLQRPTVTDGDTAVALEDQLARTRTPEDHGGDVNAAIAAGPVYMDAIYDGEAQVLTVSGTTVRWASNAWLQQTDTSVTGAFFTNVGSVAGDRAQNGIILENPQIDGSLYPSPVEVIFDSGSTTTAVIFTSAASAVDDFYNDLFLQIATGTDASGVGVRLITDYVGSTRTATLASALPNAPVLNDKAVIGYNDNAIGFAWGTENARIIGGVLKNYPMEEMVAPGAGGKGINFEQGCRDCEAIGVTVENCMTAFFASGKSGTMSTGVPASVEGIRFTGGHAENCGALLTIANLDGVAGIPDAGNEVEVIASNLTYHNCGHAPYRFVGTQQQKSGIINLMGCNGATISNIRGHNDAGFEVYPVDYAARCGFGLSGDVGAFVWGHARNTTLRDLHHYGDLDAAVHVGRVRALGDDAPPSGLVTEMRGWNIDGLTVAGTVALVVSRDEVTGVNGAEITGYWRIAVGAATAFVPAGLSAATSLVLDITEISTGKRVIGTPAQLLVRGNTFADYPTGTTDLRLFDRRSITLADDAATSFTPLVTAGLMKFTADESLLCGIVRYRVGATPQCSILDIQSNQAATTGALAGTTGTDTNFTFSTHTDGKIYIENRRGASITMVLELGIM